ncbi:endonuclease domain-containing protein [Candidatus Uhrbacteria bacterium]|nr:endonuclease domain-containing protein [Candidatus Uhrbacteria bacterium]
MEKIASPYRTFRFVSYDFDRATGVASLVYAIDDAFTFTERVTFPLPAQIAASDEALDRALFALHLAAGVSYYKAYLPPEIVVESGTLSEDEAAYWEKLYTRGLGEFFYRNNLDFREYVHFPRGEASASQFHDREVMKLDGAIVPLGGGKDSLVVVEMLRNAGIDFTLAALRGHDRIQKVADAIGQPLVVIDRAIDPLLFVLNAKGAWNGHVPVTTYVALAMVVYALLHGKRDVMFANERSANVGNVVVNGVAINHQYSKSLEAERDLAAYLASSVTPDVRVFSLLRPLSELAITKRFVENGKYFDAFSSCNKNYKIVGAQQGWCGTCPKCAFVFAMLAAFMPKQQVVGIFGKNLYADAALLPMYKELLAVEGIKPFECVGEPDEVKAAFVLAQARGDFAGDAVMEWFAAAGDSNVDIDAVLAPSRDHAIPDDYATLVYGHQGA